MAAPFRYNGSMSEPLRRLNLRPRLASAAAQLALLPDTACVADIGCDHGRLCCALLQQHAGWRCIASDLSAPSLRKAASLAAFVGVAERAEFRLGDGLLSLCPGEADAVALCGMGGTLIARLLEAAETPLMGASLGVFQPMRGVEDLRRYLFEKGYHILEDRVVRDAGRLYQVFSAAPPQGGGERDMLPPGFPPECFRVGYRAFASREPLLYDLLIQELSQARQCLGAARGKAGERGLLQRERALLTILKAWEGTGCF